MSSELSTGKTIFILAVVVGCFAVLWPKVFYPMLTASVQQSGPTQGLHCRDAVNTHHLSQLCFLLEEQQSKQASLSRWTEQDCLNFVKKSCGIVLSERILEGFRLSKDKTNLTECLRFRFDITVQRVQATAPPQTRAKPYQPHATVHPHARPERPSLLHAETMHPALREKGRTLPQRTIEKQARPGPMPGIRPPMGGGGHMVPPQAKGSGAMGIIMPLYTVGIVIFFVYTIMKVLFKKNCEEESKAPKLKDFHLDPEYRKYVFAEEYLDNSNASHRDLLRRQEREASKQRRRQDSTTQPDTKIEEPQIGLHSATSVESKGKPLGSWYLPEGFLDDASDSDECTDMFPENTVGGAVIDEAIKDTVLNRLIEEYITSSNLSEDSDEKTYESVNDIDNDFIQRKVKRKKQTRTPLAYEDIVDDADLPLMAKQNKLNCSNVVNPQKDFKEVSGEDMTSVVERLVQKLSSQYNLQSKEDQKYILHTLERKLRHLEKEEEERFDNELINKFKNAKNSKISSAFEDVNRGTCVNNNVTVTRFRFDDIIEGEESISESEEEVTSPSMSASLPKMENHLNEEKNTINLNKSNDIVQPRGENDGGKPECAKKDEQMDQLRRRLEETERAMERLMSQMGSVTDKLTAAKITEVLSQAQAQARILKEAAEGASDDDLTTSEAFTNTLSEDFSLPLALQRHLEELKAQEAAQRSGTDGGHAEMNHKVSPL